MKSFLVLMLSVIFSHADGSFASIPDYLPKDSNKVALGKALFLIRNSLLTKRSPVQAVTSSAKGEPMEKRSLLASNKERGNSILRLFSTAL